MTREMKNAENGSVVTVHEHIIGANLWEYYMLEDPSTRDVVFALVLGFENEMGDVSMRELKRHIISRTKALDEVAPAVGWSWVE